MPGALAPVRDSLNACLFQRKDGEVIKIVIQQNQKSVNANNVQVLIQKNKT
jgi:hypothetical protein